MNHKNLFVFNGIVCLLFGLPLLLTPQLILKMYAVEWEGMNAIMEVVSRGYGTLLIGLGVGLFSATKSSLSHGRRALLIIITVANILVAFVHIYATLTVKENSLGWTIVVLVLILALWSGSLLMKEKVS